MLLSSQYKDDQGSEEMLIGQPAQGIWGPDPARHGSTLIFCNVFCVIRTMSGEQAAVAGEPRLFVGQVCHCPPQVATLT